MQLSNKRRTIRTRLLMIFTIALIGTATSFTVAAQTVSANVSPTTALVANGVSSTADDVCEQRLNKALDALDKAEKALGFALNEIEARKSLDALKNQLLAVKDQYIADLVADNKFLRGQRDSVKSKVRKFLDVLEKVALIGLGVYISK